MMKAGGMLRFSLLVALLLCVAGPRAQAQAAPGDSVTIEPGKRTFLEPNYPNPFNPTTTIAYTLAQDTHVKLTVHDAFYGAVYTLVNTDQTAGRHLVVFTPPLTIASGQYFLTLETPTDVLQRRILFER